MQTEKYKVFDVEYKYGEIQVWLVRKELTEEKEFTLFDYMVGDQSETTVHHREGVEIETSGSVYLPDVFKGAD